MGIRLLRLGGPPVFWGEMRRFGTLEEVLGHWSLPAPPCPPLGPVGTLSKEQHSLVVSPGIMGWDHPPVSGCPSGIPPLIPSGSGAFPAPLPPPPKRQFGADLFLLLLLFLPLGRGHIKAGRDRTGLQRWDAGEGMQWVCWDGTVG